MYCLKNLRNKFVTPTFTKIQQISCSGQNSSIAEVDQGQQHQPISISKEALIKMRKETGYSYSKCRKALVKFGGEQNYVDALRWIKEVAIKEGWEKAAKLNTRVTSQGLCGVLSYANVAVLVELNCETDFVARSEEFCNLLQQLTHALADYSKELHNYKVDETIGQMNSIEISPKEFHLSDGRSAEEAIVSCVGKLGENITLGCTKIIYAHPSVSIIGHTHPNDEIDHVQMGRFVSLLALKRNTQNSGFPTEKLGRQIAQHIIGMVPDSLGEPPQPRADPAEMVSNEAKSLSTDSEESHSKSEEEEDEQEDDRNSEVTRIEENETQLLRQAFMFNPQQTVHEYLSHHGATVQDFIRLELGHPK